jgi:gamma-glutamylcyclotransferase (GGCT)/AIG2-like uncharacterized protein YtfP
MTPFAKMDRLFVYGTLAPGRSNAHVLADVAGTWEPATVRGRLFPAGRGAAEEYVGIVLDEQGDDVRGLVFTSAQLPDHWARLDAFEGDDYVRVLVNARLENDSAVSACVYALSSTPRAQKV